MEFKRKKILEIQFYKNYKVYSFLLKALFYYYKKDKTKTLLRHLKDDLKIDLDDLANYCEGCVIPKKAMQERIKRVALKLEK